MFALAGEGPDDFVAEAVPVVVVERVGAAVVPAVCPSFDTLSLTVIVCPLVSDDGEALIVLSVKEDGVRTVTVLDETELFVKVRLPPDAPEEAV